MNNTLINEVGNIEGSTAYPSIVKEIEDTLINPPKHGAITITLIFRDARIIRWVSARENSYLVE
jgi:hypothetical protein